MALSLSPGRGPSLEATSHGKCHSIFPSSSQTGGSEGNFLGSKKFRNDISLTDQENHFQRIRKNVLLVGRGKAINSMREDFNHKINDTNQLALNTWQRGWKDETKTI